MLLPEFLPGLSILDGEDRRLHYTPTHELPPVFQEALRLAQARLASSSRSQTANVHMLIVHLHEALAAGGTSFIRLVYEDTESPADLHRRLWRSMRNGSLPEWRQVWFASQNLGLLRQPWFPVAETKLDEHYDT